MFTLYTDYTNRGPLDTLVASQVRPCQSNVMLLSLIDPNFGQLYLSDNCVLLCVVLQAEYVIIINTSVLLAITGPENQTKTQVC